MPENPSQPPWWLPHEKMTQVTLGCETREQAALKRTSLISQLFTFGASGERRSLLPPYSLGAFSL